MASSIWFILQKFLIFFASLWKWLTTPFDLSKYDFIKNILYGIGLTELTPLGFFSVSFFSILIIYKIVRLFI